MILLIRLGFIFSLLQCSYAIAQFELEIGDQNARVADSPAERKSVSLDLNSRCTPETIAIIEESENCVGMAKPDSCYFVATTQLQTNRSGQVAAAGMLGLALLSPSTAQAAIKDHQKIRQAVLVKKSVEREFKRFAKRYIQLRIDAAIEFNHYNGRKDVKRLHGEGDSEYLQRLQDENTKAFPKLNASQLGYLKEDAGGHSILSWEDLNRHEDAKALRTVIAEDRKLPAQSREIFEAARDPRIKEVIERMGSRNPEALLQAFTEIESKKISELQTEYLGDALVNRRSEVQARLELIHREAAERADPNFQKESKAAIENLANKRKELDAAKKDGGPMKILMAKSSFDQARRELWKRIDQNAERVHTAMANLKTQSAAVQPALNSLLNFDGTIQQLEVIHARLESELKSYGILADSGFADANPLGVEYPRQELKTLKEERRRKAYWKKAKERVKAAAPVASLGLSLAAVPGLGIAKSAKIKNCADSLKLSDLELDFLLLQNPHLALLDRCEDLKIPNLGGLANASFIEFGRVPKGICDIILKQHEKNAQALDRPVKMMTCQKVEADSFSIEKQDDRKQMTCASQNILGLSYVTPLDSNGNLQIVKTKAFLKGVERPLPGADFRSAFMSMSSGVIAPRISTTTYESFAQEPMEEKKSLRYADYLSVCDSDSKNQTRLEACACAKNMVSTHAIDIVQSQFSNCASKTEVVQSMDSGLMIQGSGTGR